MPFGVSDILFFYYVQNNGLDSWLGSDLHQL